LETEEGDLRKKIEHRRIDRPRERGILVPKWQQQHKLQVERLWKRALFSLGSVVDMLKSYENVHNQRLRRSEKV